MKNISKALLYLLIPVCIDLIIVIVLAASGTRVQLEGFSFGAGIIFIFSLIWFSTINRIRMSNVLTFIRRFIFIFIIKFVLLLIILFFSLDILGSDRSYFVFGFILTTLLVLPIEIWFCLQKGKADAGL